MHSTNIICLKWHLEYELSDIHATWNGKYTNALHIQKLTPPDGIALRNFRLSGRRTARESRKQIKYKDTEHVTSVRAIVGSIPTRGTEVVKVRGITMKNINFLLRVWATSSI